MRRPLAGYMCACLVIAFSVSYGAELKGETLKTWNEYIQKSRIQMRDHLRPDGKFLWVDEVSQRSRQVRAGKILVSPIGNQVPKSVASGLIHDWIGAAFIPGAKLDDVLGVVRDYDRYKTFYKPNVVDSKSLSSDGRADEFSMLLVNREVIATTALESEYVACYLQFSDKQWYSVAYTTRIQEIRDYGHRGEQKLPPDEGSGFIWRLYTMGRLEERDGGVYIEQEAIVLSRNIPTTLRWLVDPIVRHASKNALLTSLQQTEDAVRSRVGVANNGATREATNSTCSAATPAGAWTAAREPVTQERVGTRR